MVTWKVFLLLKTYKRNWALLKHINYENMTDFRKTVETGVDPRLERLLLNWMAFVMSCFIVLTIKSYSKVWRKRSANKEQRCTVGAHFFDFPWRFELSEVDCIYKSSFCLIQTSLTATTIFSATQHCNIVATWFKMVATLFRHCNAVLRKNPS